MNPIGAIVHIDHEYDDDNVPFHLHLEDRATGNILNVSLVSGQVMYYCIRFKEVDSTLKLTN